MRIRFSSFGLAAAFCLSLAVPILAQANPVSARQALMKEIGETALALFRGAIDRIEGAEIIADNLIDVETLFPEGSQGGNALPPVWSDRETFLSRLADAQEASENLLAAAEAGDDPAFNELFRAMDGVCGRCHDTFRAEL